MGVFEIALNETGEFLRRAAIEAASRLGIFELLARSGASYSIDELGEALAVRGGRHRLRALLDVLAAIGAVDRASDRFAGARVSPPRADVPRAGWGLLADVIREDRPLAAEGGELGHRYHRHLVRAGDTTARELAPLLGTTSLLDLGGGAGTYTAAFLDAHPGARATLVDREDVIPLAAELLARFGSRVRLVAGDARTVAIGECHDAVLLANVLHLHAPATCAELCAAAARAVAPGGVVAVTDLRIDEARGAPLASLLFALNMALYTDGGDVYTASQLRRWLAGAGLTAIEERRLAASPDVVVVVGTRSTFATPPRPDPPRITRDEPGPALSEVANAGSVLGVPVTVAALEAALARSAEDAWRELARDGALRPEARPPALAFPAALRPVIARAIELERAAGNATAAERIAHHYASVMPRMRVAQLAGAAEPGATFFHTPLAWSRLPRMSAAIERLFAVLEHAGVDGEGALGARSAAAYRDQTPTLAALYERTHYGALMPLLYGYPADLAYFARRGAELGLDPVATIDRYLTAPVVHELCHFARDREALDPPHLDECVAGWLGVHVHPELAYPAAGQDDAIYAAPWLAQVGQAIARAFGADNIVRAHAGAVPWRAAVPPAFLEAAARLGRDDWRMRRSLHFLADAFEPAPWLALALASPGPDDPAFDRAIVADALRAMCLDNACVEGSFRARSRVPDAPIAIEAHAARVTTAQRRDLDPVAPSYWLPPAVAARLAMHSITGYELRLTSLAAIPEVAHAIAGASPGEARDGFTLIAHR